MTKQKQYYAIHIMLKCYNKIIILLNENLLLLRIELSDTLKARVQEIYIHISTNPRMSIYMLPPLMVQAVHHYNSHSVSYKSGKFQTLHFQTCRILIRSPGTLRNLYTLRPTKMTNIKFVKI